MEGKGGESKEGDRKIGEGEVSGGDPVCIFKFSIE